MDVDNQPPAAAAVSAVLVAFQEVHNSLFFEKIKNNNQLAGNSKQYSSGIGIGNNASSSVSNCSRDL